jgi:ABC-type Fe3+ transport system permease subunit
MSSFLNISADERVGDPGGGPDVDDHYPERTLRSHGFLAVAFGCALGLTLMIFFGLFALLKQNTPFGLYESWVIHTNPNLWYTFIIGLIAGILLSAIYNFLIFRRLNLFGLDRNVN